MNGNHIRTTIIIAAALFALASLSGCLDRRTTGTIIDDQAIEFRVIDAIYSDDAFDEQSHIKVEVHDSIVLLTGEIESEAKRELATELARTVPHVDRVVNEVEIAESAGFGERVNNTWLTAKVNTSLVKNNPVPGFDATRIKVVSSGGTVFLMGKVTREEGAAVAEIARNIRGVEKVVKVFSYID